MTKKCPRCGTESPTEYAGQIPYSSTTITGGLPSRDSWRNSTGLRCPRCQTASSRGNGYFMFLEDDSTYYLNCDGDYEWHLFKPVKPRKGILIGREVFQP